MFGKEDFVSMALNMELDGRTTLPGCKQSSTNIIIAMDPILKTVSFGFSSISLKQSLFSSKSALYAFVAWDSSHYNQAFSTKILQ
jgi:hypothetical protein